MANPRSIIKASLRSIGRIGRGRDMSAEQAADGLETLNMLIASWKGEGLMLPFRTTEIFSYSVQKNEYTIGSGGDLDTIRPIQIVNAYHTDGSGLDYSMSSMTERQYSRIHNKEVGTYPDRYYYETEYPLGKIHFDYMPPTSFTLTLISMKAITAFADLDATIDLPAEYDRALKFNLAVDLAPDYGMNISSEIASAAATSKAAIKRIARANRSEVLTVDSGIRGTGGLYSINSDSYER